MKLKIPTDALLDISPANGEDGARALLNGGIAMGCRVFSRHKTSCLAQVDRY
jgi:hypothetical protein